MALRTLERRLFGEELTPTARKQFVHAGKVAAAIVLPFLLLAILIPTGTALVLVERSSTQETADRIREQNVSRAEITYTTCLQQNERHDRTVDQLNDLIGQRKSDIREMIRGATPEQQEVLRSQLDALDDSRAATITLIDSLAPHQNCDQIVLDRFGFIPDVPKAGARNAGVVRVES